MSEPFRPPYEAPDWVYCPECRKWFRLDDGEGKISGVHAKGCPRRYTPYA